MSNSSGLVGHRKKLVLLSDNESGVLLCRPTAVARYQTGPVQDSALNYFASLYQIAPCE